MTACESCWNAAYLRAQTGGGHQADHYRDLLTERAGLHDLTPAPPVPSPETDTLEDRHEQ